MSVFNGNIEIDSHFYFRSSSLSVASNLFYIPNPGRNLRVVWGVIDPPNLENLLFRRGKQLHSAFFVGQHTTPRTI